MELHLQSMDQFPLQQSIFQMEYQYIPSPKKFTLQKMPMALQEISEDGIEHPKLLELLLAWDNHPIQHTWIFSMMELYSL